jgi:hypothetical protein
MQKRRPAPSQAFFESIVYQRGGLAIIIPDEDEKTVTGTFQLDDILPEPLRTPAD